MNGKILSLGIIKVIIIILASVYLLGNFIPFYNGNDALLYGPAAVSIANGEYGFTNEFMQKRPNGFVPSQYALTVDNTAIPIGGIGIYGLAAFSYLLGGYYGLFYLGPITGILFLIISERVITKLFGGFAGLTALIFLSTDITILWASLMLFTDSIFSLLLISGCFFLIKFLREKKEFLILLCSVFLTAATFFRYIGIIFFPVEILIVFSYFSFCYINNRKEDFKIISFLFKKDLNVQNLIFKKEIKKTLKISLYILGPWFVFFIFILSFNNYFFGEPFTTYLEQGGGGIETENIISSFIIFDSERLESIKSYSAMLTPDKTNSLAKTISLGSIALLDEYSLSIISFSLMFSALFISLYFKIKRIEIIVFIAFILSLLLFYTSNSIFSSTGIIPRYMNPILPLSFGIIGFLMYSAWKINYQKISTKYLQIFSLSWKGFLIIIFGLFFLSSLYYSNSIGSPLLKQDFEFKNPQNFADRYPLDHEGLTEKSILVSPAGKHAMQYDVIPFNPFGGYSPTKDSWASENYKQENINFLKEMLDDGYELYVFKYKYGGDPTYYRYLEVEHGLILKEHSKTFCKLIMIENLSDKNKKQIQSDEICHSFLNT